MEAVLVRPYRTIKLYKYKIFKFCPKCKTNKYATEFRNNKFNNDFLSSYCRPCLRIKRVEEYWRNHERNKFRSASYTRKGRYGIDQAEYEKMVKEQNGVCYICKLPETSKQGNKIRLLSVDHHHKSGRIRKLLCKECNLMLGRAKENPETLRKGADYLEQF
jgi:hypothetical protein